MLGSALDLLDGGQSSPLLRGTTLRGEELRAMNRETQKETEEQGGIQEDKEMGNRLLLPRGQHTEANTRLNFDDSGT